MENKRITIMDNTLREGEQTAGVVLSEDEKINIALSLDVIGVDYIEAGFPAVSQEEFDIVKKVAHLDTKASVMALARTKTEDIDLVAETGCDGVTFFIPTSDILLETKDYMRNTTKADIIAMSVAAVKHAKKKNLYIAFGAEDSTRTDEDFIIELYQKVIDAGADIVAIVDTVSRLTPVETYKSVKRFKSKLKDAPLSMHLHNDFGMATSNAVTAIMAGADQVQTTVNGIGERAGSPSLQEVVMAVNELTDCHFHQIDTRHFKEISRMINEYTKLATYPLKPITGTNSFAHESGLHVSSVLINPLSYEPFQPEKVGMNRSFVIGKHMGKSIAKHILETEYQIKNPDPAILDEVVIEIKGKAAKKKQVKNKDIFELYERLRKDGNAI